MFCGNIIIEKMNAAIEKNETEAMTFFMKNGLKVYILIVKHNNNNEYVKTIEFKDGAGFMAKNTYISVCQGGSEITEHDHFDMYIPYDEISFVGTFAEEEN